jgi:ribonuclease HII
VPGTHEAGLAAHGFNVVAGADEAGRGACAGPLVAAAVILPVEPIAGIADSKKLTAAAREKMFRQITERALGCATVVVEAAEIDEIGIQRANLDALRRALLRLDPAPQFALIDGFGLDGLPFPSLGVWKGDQVAECVSAASIVAKVTRDRIMDRLAQECPGYGFEVHKGYGTAAHQAALEALGPSRAHRLSFDNVRAAMTGSVDGR